jgi:hypothetical protein
MSKLPNDCICLFIFKSAGDGGGGFEGDSYLINSLHKTQRAKKKIKYIHQNLRYYENIEQIHFMVVKKIESYVWEKNYNI